MSAYHIEKEIKFLFSREEIKSVISKLSDEKGERVYEKTTMIDNKESSMQIEDARLRVREIKKEDQKILEFSYKRRIPHEGGVVKKEEEIEVAFHTDPALFMTILEKMGFVPVSSYERFRTTYVIYNTKTTLDEFPFGWILEIEGEEDNIDKVIKKLGLKKGNSTLESCDDVYDRLCKESGSTPKKDILFDDQSMPILR